MADGFRIDAAWLDALDNYVEGLLTDTQEAAQVTTSYLYDEVIKKAKDHPDWVGLSDNIETWSEDGRLVIGVQDDAMTSEAFATEYGDGSRPPAPLFRTLGSVVPEVQDRLTMELQARRGSFGIKGVT